MNQDNLASVIILTTMLAFVVQALARRRLAPARGFWMAAVWVVIIVVLVALFVQFPPRGG